jgi:hypothetical protein
MTDLFKLISVSWLRASRREQRWKRKTWSCGSRSMCLAGERRSDRTLTIRIVFDLFGSIDGFRPSSRWLRLSGRRPSFAGTVPGFGRIGFGASAIGRLPRGCVQNAIGLGDYPARIGAGALATVKGYVLTADDCLRADLIERV